MNLDGFFFGLVSKCFGFVSFYGLNGGSICLQKIVRCVLHWITCGDYVVDES